MSNLLFERQARLLEYLTSGGAISGEGDLSLSCFGMERGLLHLEARFSHEKRMAKIEAILPRTLDQMGSSRDAIVRDFAITCPPTGIMRLENARQFHDFLLARWREETPEPPHLPDVAAFEIAYAAVQTGPTERRETGCDAPPDAVRRHPGVVLLRTAYDIRPLLQEESSQVVPQPGEVCLALTMPRGSGRPVTQTLSPELFALLDVLDDFVPRQVFDELPDAAMIIADLAASGLLEVCR
jgi:hypothetical protein